MAAVSGSSGLKDRSATGVQVIHRAADVLRALSDSETGLSLAQISKAIGLPRSTVHRIVVALEAERFVISSRGHGYRLGTGLTELVKLSDGDLVEVAHPFLVELAASAKETVGLSVLEHGHAVHVDQVRGPQMLRADSAIGVPLPLHCTAAGKALLAQMSAKVANGLLTGRLERSTKHSIATRAALLRELDEISRTGVAIDNEEYVEGVTALGMIVHPPLGRQASVTITGPSFRIVPRQQRLTALLADACARIDKALRSAAPPRS